MTIADAPDVVVRYMRAAAEGDVATLVACFIADAEVVDEDQTFRGHDEIRRWRATLASKFTYTLEVVGSEATGPNSFSVIAKLVGNFPSSPVELKFRFVLRGELIAALEIAPRA